MMSFVDTTWKDDPTQRGDSTWRDEPLHLFLFLLLWQNIQIKQLTGEKARSAPHFQRDTVHSCRSRSLAGHMASTIKKQRMNSKCGLTVKPYGLLPVIYLLLWDSVSQRFHNLFGEHLLATDKVFKHASMRMFTFRPQQSPSGPPYHLFMTP